VAVDLHTHSTFSDGSDTPAQVVEAAISAGLQAVALTDHDGIDGLHEAADAATGRIDLIPGVELSVRWEGKAMHLLGYWVGGETPLAAELAKLQVGRSVRNREMIAALAGLDIDITEDEVAREAGPDGVTGRPHIAAVLVAKGVVRSIPEAFDAYLAPGRPAYRGRLRLDAEEATALINLSGGVAVVAHPHTVADNERGFKQVFESAAAMGIDGIECLYVQYTPTERERLADHARSMGLVPTGGSDYHGSYKAGIHIGVGNGDLHVPNTVVDELRERRTQG
jgi:3',5'-nucleoside bisphosphate phosphatase